MDIMNEVVIRNLVDIKWYLATFEYSANMITSKGEPIFAHVNMHGFRWKFMAPSSSRAQNSVMKIAERSSLKNSAESEHYSLSLTPVIPVRLFFARMKSNPAHARIIQ